MLDDLSTPDWVFAVKRDPRNRVHSLFLAHQKQVELVLSNPDVLESLQLATAQSKVALRTLSPSNSAALEIFIVVTAASMASVDEQFGAKLELERDIAAKVRQVHCDFQELKREDLVWHTCVQLVSPEGVVRSFPRKSMRS